MQLISQQLDKAFRNAFNALGIDDNIPVSVVESTHPDFGDFQVNGVMPAAKLLKTNPRDLALKVIAQVDLAGIATKVDIAGPGFINITLNNEFLSAFLHQLNPQNRFGAKTSEVQTVVVDLSSPNLAKEMHVGHLRSTVIGDSLARIYAYRGDNVIRQNHVGDWGTQFGMLIAYIQEKNNTITSGQLHQDFAITDLEQFYLNAKIKFDTNPEFANQAREYVVKLQGGDKTIGQYWKLFCLESQKHCDLVYASLNIDLGESKPGGYYIENGQKYIVPSQCGESFYNDQLPAIVEKLEQAHLITISAGAKCVFLAPTDGETGTNPPFIVQKQDGGYLYASTDLAAIDYRVHKLCANKIVYVVDARQSLHFKQLFAVAKKAGFAKPSTTLTHSAFGTMMNEAGQPFRTRDGGVIRLIDLINEAIRRARVLVWQRHPGWDEDAKNNLAQILAIGAIKYADLSKNRTSDYIFSFDQMLAFDGNTAPYLLYAHTRIQGIIRRSLEMGFSAGNIVISEVIEHKLALHLARFSEILIMAAEGCYPHYVCQYLYQLSGLFMQFYELCPILQAATTIEQQSRLALVTLAAQILHDGLDLLGIPTVEKM